MKRKWQHPTEPAESTRIHWRSLGELEESTEFKGWLEREFPQGAAELEMDETSRRSFVKLMGASTALAGFGVSCSRPLAHLVPYNEHVEWVIPGKALYYSTAKPRLGGIGCEPLVVTTYEGRPTKVDGNRLHPASSGSSNAYTQASVLDLYDQDRSKGYLSSGKATAAKDFNESFLNGFREAGSGEKVAMLVSKSTSPTRNRMLAEVQKKYPGIAIFAYEALEGPGAIYGPGIVPVANLSKASRILSLDCDFLGNEPVGEDSVAEFSVARSVEDGSEMNRLYVAESAFTLTGGMSDHRYRIPASQMLAVAALVARELGVSNAQVDSVISGLVEPVYNLDWIRECAADLKSHNGEAVVCAGGRQSEAVHSIVAEINQALGAFGPIISLYDHKLPEFGSIEDLAASLKGGGVDTLFILNQGDLVFDAPADLGIQELFSKVSTTIHLGERVNETAKAATWHVPGAHYLESWGDHYSVSGYYSVQQPMIDPLWGGVSENVFLLSLLEEESSEGAVLDWVKDTFKSVGGKNWDVALRDGVAAEIPQLAIVGYTPVEAGGKVEALELPHPEGLEVALTQGGATYDGRFVNNGWLQEAPDPITKLTWDNAALISQYTAQSFDLEDGDLVVLSVGGREVQVPVLVSPGHADFSISLALGYYGDKADGSVSRGAGFDAYPLRSSTQPYLVTGVTLRKLSGKKKYELALTAEHYSMEGRAIAREGTVEMYEEDPHFAGHQGMDHHIPENVSLYKGPNYAHPEDEKGNAVVKQIPGHEFRVDPHHQWAMVVDLNTCTGCNACVISCQAENNIPIVGKDQVLAGREMHWIRMDRYFTSPKDSEIIAERGTAWDYITGAESTEDTPGRRTIDDDAVEMISQPVACMQCESAPCETVCPVNATTHTGDGLNAMTYNRCIGTRYCANNCPYKARRFNYYDYNKRPIEKISVMGIEAEGIKFGPLAPASGHATTTQRMVKNPNVTVRMRGVIEKCTYCVQRISAAKIAAKAEARDSDDIQVKTNAISVACQDACGAGSITFGNLKDPNDKIHAAKNNPRNYDLLKYIGTRPRTSFMARIKNPNMKMPGADKVGTVTSKMH